MTAHHVDQHSGYSSKDISVSSSSSPPRKRPAIIALEENFEDSQKKSHIKCDEIQRELLNRIETLEKIVTKLQIELRQNSQVKENDTRNIDDMDIDEELTNKDLIMPNSLPDETEHVTAILPMNIDEVPIGVPEVSVKIHPVDPNHIPLLRGYRSYYQVKADGACLTNSASLHLFGNQDNGMKVKKTINYHIADNINHYRNFISFPFKETIGVGKSAKEVFIHSEEEYMFFLRSEESLKVYTNSQEMMALAKMFNINIDIFSFGGKSVGWNRVSPYSEVKFDDNTEHKVSASDMALYHSSDNHFDLLINEDNTAACDTQSIKSTNMHSNDTHEKITNNALELLLTDDNQVTKDHKEIDEEIVLPNTSAAVTNHASENTNIST